MRCRVKTGGVNEILVRIFRGESRFQGPIAGRLYFLFDFLLQAADAFLVDDAFANKEELEARDGILLYFRTAFDLRTIELFVVGERMRVRTNHVSVHKRRTFAGANVIGGL